MKQYGLNEVAREKRQSALARRLSNVKNPLVILLTALGVISFLTGDQRATVVILHGPNDLRSLGPHGSSPTPASSCI